MKKVLILLVIVLCVACKPTKQFPTNSYAQAPLIIYKTTGDYSNNVPVILNDKKDKIVSYPGVKDVFYKGSLAAPGKLKNGYLIDNIGLSTNSAYTSFTLKEYAELERAPAIDELLESIVDKDPFTEMYDCGPRNDLNLKTDANIIVESSFSGCKKII